MHTRQLAGSALALVALGCIAVRPAAADIGGFDNGSGFMLNGGIPTISGDTLTVTDGGGSEAASAFDDTPQNIGSFVASFIYQAGGGRTGDGAAFVLQNDPRGASALGAGGGNLGYNGDGSGVSISPSAAIEFNLYAPYGQGTNFYTDGATGITAGPAYLSTAPVDLSSGDPINVLLTYDGTALTESLTDTTTNAVYATSYATDLTSVLGGPMALVGFSGGTGGANAIQTISNFQFRSAAVPEPGSYALLALGVLPLAGLLARRRRA